MAGTLIATRGGQYNGEQNAPASAMARGLAITISSATIALCGDGARPDGFLATEVTADGLSWLEKEAIPHAEVEETKVSVGKVLFLLFEDGVEIATDNDGSETWAVGDKIAVAANGILTKTTATGDVYIGICRNISYSAGGQTGLKLVELVTDLGKAA